MIEELTPLEFRLKLAGLVDKGQEIKTLDKENIKEEAIRLTSILARVFGRDLDRLTLWERIGTALTGSSAKHSDNIEEFLNSCLTHVKADFANVAASDEIDSLIHSLSSRDSEWQKVFINYINKNHYIILVYARKRWNEYKEGKIEL
jgi:hypothetical protein